jgi:hypothetical protein
MSYVSLLKNIPEILSQPTGIAAIAAVGVHGAIALIVPLMPVDSSKPKETEASKTVGIMELSQADQNRLPQTPDPSQVALQNQLPLQQQLPPGSFGGQTTILPPSEPPLPSQVGMLGIPKSANNYRTSYLPREQPLPTLSRNDFRFNSGFKATRNFSPSASRFNDQGINFADKPVNIDSLPQQAQANNRSPENIRPEPGDTPLMTTPGGTATPQTIQPGDTVSNVARPGQFIAPIEQPPQDMGKLALGPSLPPGSIKKVPELPSFDKPESPSNTTESRQALAQADSYRNLKNTVEQEYPNAKQQGVIRETISTEKPGLEGIVWGVLMVAPDGKVLDIKFPDRSVSPELLSKAREYFKANPPKADKQISSYPFNLRFQNNTSKTPEPKPSQSTVIKSPSTPEASKTQPTPASATVIKSPSTPEANTTQPTPASATVIKSPSTPEASKIQPTPASATIIKPVSAPTESNNQPTPSAESPNKLTQKLREVRDAKSKP